MRQEEKCFHIVQIVIKNTSTLDFSIPILWGLRKKYPSAKISILYTSLNKDQVLRKSTFMRKFCAENRIVQYDLCDFLQSPYKKISNLLRRCFAKSYSERVKIFGYKAFLKRNIISNFKDIAIGLTSLVEKLVSRLTINTKQIMFELNPDIILFDNRSVTNFYGRNDIYSYLDKVKIPVILLPHAPHYNGESAEFCRFDEFNDILMPDYTEHWMPFKFGQPWKAAPLHRAQFFKIGYPGLDKAWSDYLVTPKQKKPKKRIRCLVLSRKCLTKYQNRPAKFDNATLNYAEGLSFYTKLRKSIENSEYDIEIYIKPHPSSSHSENEIMLKEAGLKNYTITYEYFYGLLPNIDAVISQYSTALSLPIAFDIPTMLIQTDLQISVQKSWPLLADYYLNFKYYTPEEDFSINFVKLLNDVKSGKKDNMDNQLMRSFFDDGAINCAIGRVENFLELNHGVS